jgi:hypothetical protein
MPNEYQIDFNLESADEPQQGLDLIYKIEEKTGEVDVFELSRVLESFGNVLRESYRVAYPENGELVVRVKPFEEGSFLMDLVLSVQQNPAVLFALAHPEAIQNAKNVLGYLGFIKKPKDTGTSLLELLLRLKNGRPENVEKKGPNHYEYRANDGSVMPVNSTVHALYNNPVINNYTFNIVAPVERESVESIRTFLKPDREGSEVEIGKQLANAVRAFAAPKESSIETEVLEDTTTKILHPKSGNYGGTSGRGRSGLQEQKDQLRPASPMRPSSPDIPVGAFAFFREIL